ncbi:MAG: GNAT family N-acetyltransferase [Phycisphaerales bacterium]|nr:MAG: GNAT family N-acetyltransferase [Phycisphaerales bacterium]
MEPRVRDAREGDMSFLVEGLESNRALEGRAREDIRATRSDMEALKDGVARKNVRVAEVEGEAVGFLHFRTDFRVMYLERAGVFWVDLVYVKEGHRGKGLGRLLYEDAARIAREGRFDKMVIDIFAANANSQGFHRKLGFKPVYTIYQKEL